MFLSSSFLFILLKCTILAVAQSIQVTTIDGTVITRTDVGLEGTMSVVALSTQTTTVDGMVITRTDVGTNGVLSTQVVDSIATAIDAGTTGSMTAMATSTPTGGAAVVAERVVAARLVGAVLGAGLVLL